MKVYILTIEMYQMLLVLLCIATICVAAPSPTEIGHNIVQEDSIDGRRLPHNVVPNHYSLTVQPYLIPGNFTFVGEVNITVTCKKETDRIVLHSSGLNIGLTDVNITRIPKDSHQMLDIKDIEFKRDREFMIISLTKKLKVNDTYLVTITYNGKMGTSPFIGLYISKYTDDDGNTHYVAATQFETIYARRVFPCFDEPKFKTTFNITVVRWRNMTSASNMPKIYVETRDKEWDADTFITSMNMSTYLVAFVIGEYVTKGEGKVAIWAPKYLKGSPDFALDFSLKALQFFENILRIYFEAPKLDMIAVTDHMVAGMENWGLITYKAEYLLQFTNEITPISNNNPIATVIAHEIAHQWFGNLVTAEWWSDVWLNEGFATYMQQLALKQLNQSPTVVDEGLFTSVKIYEEDCSSADTAYLTVWKNITYSESSNKVFGMVYEKGAAILRMIHHFLGDKTFWKYITVYLKNNSYDNVNETVLWRLIDKAQFETTITHTNMMQLATWTHLPGLPIVTVERNYVKRSATFSQRSCRMNDDFHKNDLWHIPVTYRGRSEDKNQSALAVQWLSDKNRTLYFMPDRDDWIIVNDEGAGYYVVNYDKQNWKLLIDQLQKDHKVFTRNQRFKLLADALFLFRLKDPVVTADLLLSLRSYLLNAETSEILEHKYYYSLIEKKRRAYLQ